MRQACWAEYDYCLAGEALTVPAGRLERSPSGSSACVQWFSYYNLCVFKRCTNVLPSSYETWVTWSLMLCYAASCNCSSESFHASTDNLVILRSEAFAKVVLNLPKHTIVYSIDHSEMSFERPRLNHKLPPIYRRSCTYYMTNLTGQGMYSWSYALS